MDLALQQHIALKLNSLFNSNLNYKWQQIGGGSINETYKISNKLQSFFIKINTITVFNNGFKEEVLGLNFLQINNILVPKVVLEGIFKESIYLVLEWIEPENKTTHFWENFAEQLATLHFQTNDKFGLDYSNFMGKLPQKNTFNTNFTAFFIQNRLKPQVKIAFDNLKLNQNHIAKFENLYKQLPTIFPKEKPSALHGDLWSGNFICSTSQKAVLVDPAVYYGNREVDLSMSLLFGGFSTIFYENYRTNYPLISGFNKRKDYYNLYPLLVHLNLFGSTYLKSIDRIITKF